MDRSAQCAALPRNLVVPRAGFCQNSGPPQAAMSPQEFAEQIALQIENYLSEAPSAVVVENGNVIFDFSTAHYSVSPERDKCVLQIWSDERNIVRRVVTSDLKNGMLRLSVMRMGQAKPSRLEICALGAGESPSARRAMRAQFQRLLVHALERQLPGWTIDKLASGADLSHSFGPAFIRGTVHRGQSYFAVVGVAGNETQATIDASVSMAVLWLEHCRKRLAGRGVVEGVMAFVPQGRAATARLRMAHLNPAAAKWRLFALDERAEHAEELDTSDIGNIETRLVRCPDTERVLAQLQASIAHVRGYVPQAEAVVRNSSEVCFRLLGLEFASARLVPLPESFKVGEVIVFGAGAAEFTLTPTTESMFRDLTQRLLDARYRRNLTHPLYRMRSERWLESILKRDVSVLDDRLDPSCLYAQVPAFAASDRAMIDLLGVTRRGRLTVVELKAEEDIHLPMQGLDYWARVRWLQRCGDFQRDGYFPGRELSSEDPVLILAAPSLHVHPATDTLLRYLSPEVEWVLLGLDEHWREGVRVIFRRRKQDV